MLTAAFDRLLVYVGFTLTLNAAAAVLAAFVLRWREPASERPHRALGWPFSGVLFLALATFMIVLAVRERPLESAAALATLVLGGLAYAALAPASSTDNASVPPMTSQPDRPAPLAAVLAVTFAGSLSGGVFWAAIFFVTAGHYGFSPERNLVLAAVMGAVYAVTAAGAGRLVRRLSSSSSPRTVLMAALAGWTIAALMPLAAPHSEAVMWGAALLGAVASAVTWPIVESYLSAGRHGAEMRAAIGWFNVTWTPATALALLLMPIVTQVGMLAALALSAAGSIAALIATFAAAARSRARTSRRRRRRRSGASTSSSCARCRGCCR